MTVTPNMSIDNLDKIMSRVRYDSGCWEWTGARQRAYGHGVFRTVEGYTAQVHRAAYRLIVGDPGALVLDHLCRTPWCCNPYHLEPVSNGENVRRGASGRYLRARTHCPQGHEYTADNTRIKQPGDRRECRQCGRDYYHRSKGDRQ